MYKIYPLYTPEFPVSDGCLEGLSTEGTAKFSLGEIDPGSTKEVSYITTFKFLGPYAALLSVKARNSW